MEGLHDCVFSQDPCSKYARPLVGSIMAYHWNELGGKALQVTEANLIRSHRNLSLHGFPA